MKGWILYRRSQEYISSEDYSIQRLLEAGKAKGIELTVVAPKDFELILTQEDRRSVYLNDKLTPLPDFILPRTGSGSTYFTLAILRHLEQLGVYVCNTAQAIETVKDKLHCHQVLAHNNIPTPKTMLVKFPIDIKVVERNFEFPIIVKNITGSEGNGIYLSSSPDMFNDLMELIYSNNPHANILIQEFVKTSHGKDLRVMVVGGQIIGCMQRNASNNSFKANFSRGGKVAPFELPQEAAWIAIQTAHATNLEITGVDLLFTQDGFKVCEANSSPNFEGLEQVTGKNIAEQILDYIMLRVSNT